MQLFLDINDSLRLSKLRFKAGVVASELGNFVVKRTRRLWFWARQVVFKHRFTARQALPPFGNLRLVNTVATEQGTAPSVPTRIEIVLFQDRTTFSSSSARALS